MNCIKSKNISHRKDDKDVNNIIAALQTKDLSSFKKLVYLPKVLEKVNKMKYTEEDFNDGAQASKHGDDAIKLLYIPPFALSVSIIALLLNLFTVFGMLLSLSKYNASKKMILTKMIFVGAVILLPFLSSNDGLHRSILEKSSSNNTQNYLSFLQWISYYQKLNSSLHMQNNHVIKNTGA